MLNSIKATFTESIQTQIASAEALPEHITKAAQILLQCLLNGNKVLACGNGAAAANSQQFVACMINRFETERPSLPAFALNADNITVSSIANDNQQTEIFSKQVRAFGQHGDVLFVLSSSGNNKNIIKAMEAALSRDMSIIALTGKDGGEMAGLFGLNDVEIRIPSQRSARIHEGHLLTIHCLCDLIDQMLFPQHEG